MNNEPCQLIEGEAWNNWNPRRWRSIELLGVINVWCWIRYGRHRLLQFPIMLVGFNPFCCCIGHLISQVLPTYKKKTLCVKKKTQNKTQNIFGGFRELSFRCVTLEMRLTDVWPLFSHRQLILTNDTSQKCFLISTIQCRGISSLRKQLALPVVYFSINIPWEKSI